MTAISRAEAPLTIWLLTAAVALVGANGFVLSPILTAIAADLDASAVVTARAIAAHGAATAVSALLLGRQIDRKGARTTLRLAMAGLAVALLATSLAPTWWALALAQAVAGAATGLALPSVYALAATLAPKGAEARTTGRVLIGWSISLVAALPLAALTTDLLGWRALYVGGALAAGCVAIAVSVLPETVRRSSSADANPFAPLALPGAWRVYGQSLLYMAAFFGAFGFAGDHVRSSFGVSTTEAGIVSLCYGVGFTLAGLFAGVLDRFGPRRAAAAVMGLLAAIYLALGAAPDFGLFLLAAFFWGALNNVGLNLMVVGFNALDPPRRGLVLALYSATTYVAAVLAVIGLGPLYEYPGYGAVTVAAAFMAAVGAILIMGPVAATSRETGE